MGLADFLATAGQGKTLGHVAEAFGGQTSQQKAVDDFINNQLPALADQIHKASTKEDVTKAGQSMITGGLKAGISPQGLDKLMEMTIQPALRNMQSGELDKLNTNYAAQPGLEASPRPESSPSLVKGPNVPATPALPERPLDLNFMMKFGQATNANPEQYNRMLETPATIAGKQASTQHTQTQIAAEQAKEKTIQGLPNTPTAEGQPSQQAVARVPGLAQFLDARGKPEDPLLEEKRREINARADRLDRMPAGGDRPAHGSGEYQDYIKLLPPGQTPSMEGFQGYLDRRRGAGKTNETEAAQPYGSLDREIDLKTIARDAHKQGKTSSADIKKLAAQRGLEVEGDPQLTMTGGASAFGYNVGGTPELTGEFTVKKKPRVTTKTKTSTTGDQGRYSDPGSPSGSAPVPRDSKAGGAGSGGSGKALDADTAKAILQEAGGDKEKARSIAKQRGFKF